MSNIERSISSRKPIHFPVTNSLVNGTAIFLLFQQKRNNKKNNNETIKKGIIPDKFSW